MDHESTSTGEWKVCDKWHWIVDVQNQQFDAAAPAIQLLLLLRFAFHLISLNGAKWLDVDQCVNVYVQSTHMCECVRETCVTKIRWVNVINLVGLGLRRSRWNATHNLLCVIKSFVRYTQTKAHTHIATYRAHISFANITVIDDGNYNATTKQWAVAQFHCPSSLHGLTHTP